MSRGVAIAIAVGLLAACRSGAHDGGAASCASAASCGPGELCDYEPGLCGKGKRPGTCRPRPRACPERYDPVCACDGQVYPSACAAAAAGVDLEVNGGCGRRIPDWIISGGHYCDARTSYCEIVLSDVRELPTDYTCKPLPAGCAPTGGAAPSCRCLPPATRCLSFCSPVDTGGVAGLRLTCRR